VDATTWANATNHGFFVILNVAMGGAFPAAFGGGPTSATESGHPMLVDYVQVLSSSGSGTTTPPPSGNRDAYSAIQAESYDSQSGVSTETTSDTGGGQDVGFIAPGDSIAYTGVNFGTSTALRVMTRRASGSSSTGTVQYRLDSVTGPIIASVPVSNTGGWQSWGTVTTNLSSSVTGVHTVFITFTGPGPEFVNLNWFQFAR
jgi:hypothetical protein